MVVGTEDLLRELAPQVLGALVRRYGHFDTAEDAVQEGLLAAATQWPADGVPDDPRAWLIRVASRRLIDQLRSDESRRLREENEFVRDPAATRVAPPADERESGDDSLVLLFLCCHPAIAVPAQVALTLRAVGGLTTGEIASAFLVPEPTMGQRISRAKQKIKSSGVGFEMPPPESRGARLDAVLQVLYLIFNEGYTSSSGPRLARVELSAEAIRLARMLHRLLPDDGEAAGLLALMLLTDARRPARTGADGELIPLDEQDRSRWDQAAIAEGVALVSGALARTRPGAYQLQAAIAAVHDEAPTAADTDWAQVLALYELLEKVSDSPMVTLNKAVAVAMVQGPRAGLDLLATLDGDDRVARHHRLAAVRAHLLELAGDAPGAAAAYQVAADRTLSEPEQRYLRSRAHRLAATTP
ncbi:sigma-70 family RNA polymerase sigma factor [Asanoa sp. WMMD1127]|uniref:RNA polymerase sigma factor n=1 Tax=Asanoa sp. WMMD1127 TaxID=3016107 RepID=UPI002416185C|nr:sigma-70 family RNA polymerase sigma factor [Asanoa sp. WMMD1127]MDG4821475.1 sigma-70 family RNA polymerase sigma factor [Asanoa sp. WMMD1127]